MQLKLIKHNKWYNSKKKYNVANIRISNVFNEKDLSELYKIFNEIIVNCNVLLNFSSRHEFDDATIISESIETLKDYVSNNNGHLEFINKQDIFWLDGIAQLQRKDVNEKTFEKICSTFEGVTFYNSSSRFEYTDLKKLLKSNRKIKVYEYLISNNLVNATLTFSNDGLSAYISFNSDNIDSDELLNRIKLAINNN